MKILPRNHITYDLLVLIKHYYLTLFSERNERIRNVRCTVRFLDRLSVCKGILHLLKNETDKKIENTIKKLSVIRCVDKNDRFSSPLGGL